MKIGVFFGAGAEAAYEMPLGMEFAANILFPDINIMKEANENFDLFLMDKLLGKNR